LLVISVMVAKVSRSGALGFHSVACGPDGREARAIAKELNKRWDVVRAEAARQAPRQVGRASRPIYQALDALSRSLAEKLEDELECKRESSQSEFCFDFVPRSALRCAPQGPHILRGADIGLMQA
jgi:hypothetical protein